MAIAFSSFLRRTIYPFFVSVEMVPKIAFAPLFISWLGFGLLPKIIIVFVTIANRINVAYPIVLVLGGMAIGFIPGIPTFPLRPELEFCT